MARRHVRFLTGFALGIGALALAACGGGDTRDAAGETGATAAGEVNLYSTRHYDSDKLMFDAFEAETGIKVNVREAGAAQLLETMKAEGEASPADIIIAADAGTLWRFKDAGLTGPVESVALNSAIPANLRDPEGHWYGLAKRYRTIVYDTEAVSADEVSAMADLAGDRFDGEVCARSSSNIYNLSLLGEIIAHAGEEAAEDWAREVADNFARDPAGGDTAQIKAVAAGACTIAISNHYYWVRLATSGSADDRNAAASTAVSFADAGDGAHVNITGAAVAANGPNRENAIALLEFMASETGQAFLVTETKEFPVVARVPLPEGLEVLSVPAESTINLAKLGENQFAAQRAFDRAGWP